MLIGSCSSSGPDDDLRDVAEQLRDLEQVSLSLVVAAGDVGFAIDGVLSVTRDRPLPVANLTYTPAGAGVVTTVVLTGHDGFVVVDDQAYRLPPDQLAPLRIPPGGGRSALSTIRLHQWLDVDTRRDGTYEGDGDPDVVLDDVVALASGLGARDALPGTVEGRLRVRVVADDEGNLQELVASADDFRFVLDLDRHGKPVEVEPPANPRPFDELVR